MSFIRAVGTLTLSVLMVTTTAIGIRNGNLFTKKLITQDDKDSVQRSKGLLIGMVVLSTIGLALGLVGTGLVVKRDGLVLSRPLGIAALGVATSTMFVATSASSLDVVKKNADGELKNSFSLGTFLGAMLTVGLGSGALATKTLVSGA